MDNLLRKFECCEILDYKLDLLNNKFQIELNHFKDGKHILTFNEVSTFYFIHDKTDERKTIYTPAEEKGLETSDIGILDDTIAINLASDTLAWAKEYSGKGNVFIEIWEQLLIIEAKSLDINGECIEIT